MLSDTSCLTFLDVSSSDLIQKCCLACIDVTENSANGTSELALLSLEEDTVISQDTAFFFFLQLFSFKYIVLDLFFSFFSSLLWDFDFCWCIFLSLQLFSDSIDFFFLLLCHMESFLLFELYSFFLLLSKLFFYLFLLSLFLLLFFSDPLLLKFELSNSSLLFLLEFLLLFLFLSCQESCCIHWFSAFLVFIFFSILDWLGLLFFLLYFLLFAFLLNFCLLRGLSFLLRVLSNIFSLFLFSSFFVFLFQFLSLCFG